MGTRASRRRVELLRVRHRECARHGGQHLPQVTALSLLVSMYLQSVYAASSEEIEIFLSPVASRSRVREAVRGLSATRQIHSLSMDAQTYYFLEGGLPEFAALAEPPADSMRSPEYIGGGRARGWRSPETVPGSGSAEPAREQTALRDQLRLGWPPVKRSRLAPPRGSKFWRSSAGPGPAGLPTARTEWIEPRWPDGRQARAGGTYRLW